jgi:hypothetical protein
MLNENIPVLYTSRHLAVPVELLFSKIKRRF